MRRPARLIEQGQVVAHAGVEKMPLLGHQADARAHRRQASRTVGPRLPAVLHLPRDRRSAAAGVSAPFCRYRCGPPPPARGPVPGAHRRRADSVFPDYS